MENRNHRANRWRKKGRRGVSPIIATILLVAITVVLAAVLYILISGLTKGPGNTPLGTALAVSTPLGNTPNYTVTIQTASGGLQANHLNFQIQNAQGQIQTTGTTVTLLSITGCQLAQYAFSSSVWTSGTTGKWCSTGSITTTLQSGQQFVITTSATEKGNTLVILGTGAFSGSVSTTFTT